MGERVNQPNPNENRAPLTMEDLIRISEQEQRAAQAQQQRRSFQPSQNGSSNYTSQPTQGRGHPQNPGQRQASYTPQGTNRPSQHDGQFQNRNGYTPDAGHPSAAQASQGVARQGNEDGGKVFNPETKKPRKKLIPIIGSCALGSLLVVSGIVATDTGNSQQAMATAIESFTNESSATPILETEQSNLTGKGTDSFKPDQCNLPGAVAAVAYVTAEFPLVARLVNTTNPTTPMNAEPYLTEEKISESDDSSELSNFETDDGYPFAEIRDMPLAMKICGTNTGEISDQGDILKIDRAKITITFEDPTILFGRDDLINVAAQNNAAHETDVDASNNEFLILPKSLWIEKGTDEVMNASIDAVNAAMDGENQDNVILALLEAGAINKLGTVVDNEGAISFPDGMDTLTEAVDRAIQLRVVGNRDVKLDVTNNYTFSAKVPINKATTLPVTANNPDGSNPLIGLDPTQQVRLVKADVVYERLAEPPKPEAPDPTPSETPSPSATPATTTP